MKRIMFIAGARPNFMKIAPLIREVASREGVESILVHTGQHYDRALSTVFFEELEIPAPDYNLGVGSLPREEQIQAIEQAFEPLLLSAKPDAVVVVGDVNSTIACASVAKRNGVLIAHVEAGLRSFDTRMPEELNRVQTDSISDLLFVTEESGMRHLKDEAVNGESFLVGNVMIDTLVRFLELAKKSDVLSRLNIEQGNFICSTFHRPSNVDSKDDLRRVIEVLRTVSKTYSVVLPLHPRTAASLERNDLDSELRSISRLMLVEPLGYLDFLKLISSSKGVVTDSGGIQEETTYLGVPCITVRENTERPSTIELGTNELVGLEPEKIGALMLEIEAGTYKKGSRPPLWDGAAAGRILDILCERI